MPASNTATTADNRFQSLSPASLSRTEKSSVIKLALAVLSARYRPGRAFTSPEDIEGFLRLKLPGRRNEVFGIVYLDTRHRLIEIAELFNGTGDGAAVYPRVVVQKALEKNAAAVVLFHNHPSGVAEPSESDRSITQRLSRALALIDVRLLDHLVVTDGAFVSLAERGWIQSERASPPPAPPYHPAPARVRDRRRFRASRKADRVIAAPSVSNPSVPRAGYFRGAAMTDTERTIRCIALTSLVPSPENVRKTPAEGSAFDQLKASIAAHGLLENLLVRPQPGDAKAENRYEVIAGGRRLVAFRSLADDGAVAPDHPVPCHVVTDDDNAAELSLVENTVRAAMHPADQVEAFARIAADGGTAAEIAARFGVSERTVEQRLRLGNAAPQLLDAYRAGEMGLQCLQAFCVTTDAKLQLAVWEELKAQHYGPSVWQIRRLMTEGRMPATSAVARFVGIDRYEAAGGALTRDLFAEEDERGIWFDDPALLRKLALERLETAAEELRTKWSWAEARVEVEWSDTARFARIRPKPGEPTADEAKEVEQLTVRRDELTELDDDAWTDESESELERIEARLQEIDRAVAARAVFRRTV